MDSFDKQIADFVKALENKQKKAESDSLKFVRMSCAKVEGTAKEIMRDTITDPGIVYGKRGHHPSKPGNPPAVDTGTLRQSISHSIEVQNGKAIGYVGSTIKNPEYPKWLEYGTSKMAPRPWLSTSLIKCQSWMANLWKEIFKK